MDDPITWFPDQSFRPGHKHFKCQLLTNSRNDRTYTCDKVEASHLNPFPLLIELASSAGCLPFLHREISALPIWYALALRASHGGPRRQHGSGALGRMGWSYGHIIKAASGILWYKGHSYNKPALLLSLIKHFDFLFKYSYFLLSTQLFSY